jgi:hypothetical protein
MHRMAAPRMPLFGNNASTSYFYGANAMYRLSDLQTNSAGINVQHFSYTYDAIGNITQLANTGRFESRSSRVVAVRPLPSFVETY